MAGSGRNLLQALEYWGKEQPEKVRSLRGSGTASVTVEIGRQIGTDSDHHPPITTRGGGGGNGDEAGAQECTSQGYEWD